MTLLLGEIQNLSPADMPDGVSERAGEDLLQVLLIRIADQISSAYRGPAEEPSESRLARLQQALFEGGYSPEVTQQGHQVEVRLCNCPYRAAALCQKSVCLLDRTLISSILGVEPTCQATIRDGSNACSYLVSLTDST